jgi:hypothetical protein
MIVIAGIAGKKLDNLCPKLLHFLIGQCANPPMLEQNHFKKRKIKKV